MDMMQIEKVVSAPSSAAGSFRDVWFFGDIVIKKDKHPNATVGCQKEYRNYLRVSDTTFEFRDETWSLRFPQTSMVGEYLIMQRIDFPDADPKNCKECIPYAEDSWEDNVTFYSHTGLKCFLDELDGAVGNKCADVGIYDMHSLNFKYDIDTRTVWVIDFAG